MSDQASSDNQPIGTAPKDRRILVFVPDVYGNPTTSGWFTAQWNSGIKWSGWESGYVDYMDEAAQLGDPAPTHWRELPPAP